MNENILAAALQTLLKEIALTGGWNKYRTDLSNDALAKAGCDTVSCYGTLCQTPAESDTTK